MPIQSTPILSLPVTADGAIAAHRFVTPVGDQAVAGEYTLGVARTAAADATLVTVDVLGTTVVEAGAAINAGATLKSDADGKAITWATSGAKVAVALAAAAAEGDLIEVLLIPNAA
jgi:hypothetical protein